MMRFLLQDIFATTLTLALGFISASIAFQLMRVKRKWMITSRRLGEFFMLMTGISISIYIVNKDIMKLKHGVMEFPFSHIHMAFEFILVLTFAYILFLSIKKLVKKTRKYIQEMINHKA